MSTEPDDFREDPLWRLLGKAKPAAVSPFFSRNILREIRNSGERQDPKLGLFGWLAVRRRFAALLLAVAIVLAGVEVQLKEKSVATISTQKKEILVAQQLAKNPDSEVIKNLDELLASDDNSVWLDNSAF